MEGLTAEVAPRYGSCELDTSNFKGFLCQLYVKLTKPVHSIPLLRHMLVVIIK